MSIVLITKDRRQEVLQTLAALRELPERPTVIVVDNASRDGAAEAIQAAFPAVQVVRLASNRGALARNLGVSLAQTPYVAFSDDDSWWDAGALECAARAFEAHPRLALIAGRVVVEPGGSVDAASERMARAPIGWEPDLPGPSVVGHLACASIVRRSAFLEVGGYSEVLFFGGEEQLLAIDLIARGYGVCYMDGVVARHRPSPVRDVWGERWARYRRNDVLVSWMRRRITRALWDTAGLMRDAVRESTARRSLLELVTVLPAALRRRRPLPRDLERSIAQFAGGDR